MPHRLSLVVLLAFCLGAQLFGGVPVLTSTPAAEVPVRLQENASFSVTAADEHPLAYLWQIIEDPTQVAVISNPNSTTANVAFPWVNRGIGAQPIGQSVRLRVTVSHANPQVDGEASVSYEFAAKIATLNLAPIPNITGFFGSREAPLRPGDAIVADAGNSQDPDSSGFRAEWLVGFERGGGTFVQRPAPIGSEGTLMTITVPNINGTGLVEMDITLILLDGLHDVRLTKTAYMQNGSSSGGNTAPRLVFPQTVSKLTSEQIAVSGTVEDLDGDDCDFTWSGAFLQGGATGMNPIISLIQSSPTRKWQVSGVYPPLALGNYTLTITAREKNTADHKQTSANILVAVTNGGGNNPPQNGPPEYSETTSGCVGKYAAGTLLQSGCQSGQADLHGREPCEYHLQRGGSVDHPEPDQSQRRVDGRGC